jgi:glycosyltransferase involved in cell wall biosynthesis
MSYYLREMGHSVTVVACNAWGVDPADVELDVLRVGDLRSSSALRRLLRRGSLTLAGDPLIPEPPPTALLTKVFVPDIHVVTWLPQLVTTLRKLVRHRRFDCIITTSPPETAHLSALLLGDDRPPWIADFRDGWLFEPWRENFPTQVQRSLDESFERRVVCGADVVVAATKPISDDLVSRLGSDARWVSNGWDPRMVSTGGTATIPERDPGVTLVYTGTIVGPRNRDVEPFFRALSSVRAASSAVPIRLVHAGNVTTVERELIDRSGVGDAVQHLGMLGRSSTHLLQRTADALVLLTSRSSSEATSKLFEYLAAGRPILALAEGNEAERIVRQTGTGIAVPPDDVEAIEDALRRVISGELAEQYAPHDMERFLYPAPAEEMASLVELAIRRHASIPRRR